MENYERLSTLQYFSKISKIPRIAGQEGKMIEFLVNFAKQRNLEYFVDTYGNVIIYKNTNDRQPTCLQSGIDMQYIKKDSCKLDYSLFGNEFIKKGPYISSKRSSIGSKNTSSTALILSLLDSDIPLNVEAVFCSLTTCSNLGIKSLDVKKIKSKNFICFSSGENNALYNQSCQSCELLIKFNNDKIFLQNSQQLKTFELNFLNSLGEDYIEIKLLFDLLDRFPQYYINKIYCTNNSSNQFIKKVVFTTTMSEYELKKIIKYFYIKTKFSYHNLKIKCVRQLNQTLVLNSLDFSSFIKQINLGVVINDAFNYMKQFITEINTDSGFLKLKIISFDRKKMEEQVEFIEKYCKKLDCSITELDSLYSFSTDADSGLIKNLQEIPLVKRCALKRLDNSHEIGFLQKKLKDINIVSLPLHIINENTVEEKIEISSIINNYNILKEYFLNLKD